MIFAGERRAGVKEEQPGFTLGARPRWKEVDTEEKAEFETKAATAKKAYVLALEAYKRDNGDDDDDDGPAVVDNDDDGKKSLNQSTTWQAREDAGVSRYAPSELEAEVVDNDAVDNVVVDHDNVHNEVEADIVAVRNRLLSKKRMAKERAKQKREAAANLAALTATALPSGTLAVLLKQ
ncbi:hypothetical protein T492DRAFT_871631 [Pavlovales sp. CCMP2436]|nr:hypothetical protein T492DRAFT_871631 [Pavlovales sp. CCMP2436]